MQSPACLVFPSTATEGTEAGTDVSADECEHDNPGFPAEHSLEEKSEKKVGCLIGSDQRSRKR